jgi:glycosyltransferase involved in cell wall biosynthesis
MSRLVEQGQARIKREFSRDVILNQYLDLYRRLAGG